MYVELLTRKERGCGLRAEYNHDPPSGDPLTGIHRGWAAQKNAYRTVVIRDDVKTVQENLCHATASFTLDVYGHVTERMKQAGADQMEQFIKTVSG